MLAEKLKLPEVVGALLAGVVLGPLVFNVVKYDASIELLSQLGVILLMFHAGLETDLEQMKKAGKSAAFIALLGVALPLVLGTACAFLFFDDALENVFIGVVLTATSVSITVETLNELGKLNTRVGINILGAAVIDDILGLLLVSLLLAVKQGTGTGAVYTVAAIVVFFTCFTLAVVFLPKQLDKLMKRVKSDKTLTAFAVALTLLIAVISEELGIAAITGAYLFGLLLSKTQRRKQLERHINVLSASFLSPIFFASVGLSISLNGLNSKTLLIGLTMLAVALAGKLIGCGFAARLFGMKRSEAAQIGIGMISRGEVAIITANIGVKNGIISDEVFIPTIFVVLLTTIITPLLLKPAFSHKHERRLDEKRRAGGAPD